MGLFNRSAHSAGPRKEENVIREYVVLILPCCCCVHCTRGKQWYDGICSTTFALQMLGTSNSCNKWYYGIWFTSFALMMLCSLHFCKKWYNGICCTTYVFADAVHIALFIKMVLRNLLYQFCLDDAVYMAVLPTNVTMESVCCCCCCCCCSC